jgi:F-type H+-transporting ATPase subunit b
MHLEISIIISQIIAFLVLFWILKRFIWKPLFQILESRKKKIAEEFQMIETQKKDLEALHESYKKKLSEIENEARQKIQDAIKEGHQAAHDIQEAAHRQAKSILVKAQQDISLEVEKARSEFKDSITALVFDVAEKFIGEKLDPEKEKNNILHHLEKVHQE